MIFLQAALANNGQVQAVTSGTVTSFNGPQAYVGSNPLVSTDATAATDSFVGGFRYKSDGALRIYEGVGDFVREGIAVTAQGQLCVAIDDVDADDAVYFGGCALTNDGRVYMSTGSASYTGPLDLVPGAVVAYGVRALSAAMLGQNIFRLRRDSDDAEMDFAADAVTGAAPEAAILTWLDSESGYFVRRYDQTGGGNHEIQTTAANQPRWAASGQTGGFAAKPATWFESAADQFFVSTAPASLPNGAYSLSQVALVTAGGSFPAVGFGYDAFSADVFAVVPNSSGIEFDATTDGGSTDFVGGLTNDITGFSDAAKVIAAAWTLGSKRIYVDNVSQSIETDYDTDAVGAISGVLAEGAADATPSTYYTGSSGETIVYPSQLSVVNIGLLAVNQAAYYGITL